MLILAFLSLIFFFFASEVTQEDSVFQLTDDDFDDFFNTHDYVLVMFHAPWCGHCKSLSPEYAKAAQTLASQGSTSVLAKVDCTIHTGLQNRFSIQGFPTLKFFRTGNPIDYDGGRTAADIISFVTKKSAPPSTTITSEDQFQNFISQHGTKVVAYLRVGSDLLDIWISIAKSTALNDFLCAHVVDSSFGKPEGSVFLFKQDGENLGYEGEFTQNDITKWVSEEGYPLISVLAQEVWVRSSQSAKPLLAVFAADTSQITFLQTLAKETKGQLFFTESNMLELSTRWGSSTNFPTAIYVNWVDGQPKMTVWNSDNGLEFNEDNLRSFIRDARNGVYVSYQKSEPIPEPNDDPVTIVVAKNFDQVVRDDSKDVVFVKFYAPWCGHCKTLAPIWDELGEDFDGNSKVVIAKIDATANSLPNDVGVRGYPTLIAFVHGTQIPYDGDRTLGALKNFVESHLIPHDDL